MRHLVAFLYNYDKCPSPSLRKIFGNSQGEISFYEYPDSPRYEIRARRIDWARPQTMLYTDNLIEAELAFREAMKAMTAP